MLGRYLLHTSIVVLLCSDFFSSQAIAQRIAAVNIEPVKIHQLTNLVRYSGRIQPEIIVTQAAQFPGQVIEVLVKPNQKIAKDQVIMRLARRAIGREFSAFELRANIAGIVNDLPYKAGMEFNQGDDLVELVDVSNLVVKLNVSDKDRHMLQPGQQAEISLRSGRTLTGEVYKILLRPSEVTPLGLFPVEIKVKEPRPELIGQLVEVSVVVEEYKGIAVPRTALIERDRNQYVFVYNEQTRTVSQAPIESGQTFGPMIAVASGLEEGVQLVVESSSYLSDGEQVNLRTSQGPSSRRRR